RSTRKISRARWSPPSREQDSGSLRPRLARNVRLEDRIEERVLFRGNAAADDGERALGEAVDPEPRVYVGDVHCRGEERTEPEVGADEVERLAQVRRVEEHDRVRALVPVFPERAVEPRGEQKESRGALEVELTARELVGELGGLRSVEPLEQLECVPFDVVVIDPRVVAFDRDEERIDLDRVQATTGRTRAMQADDTFGEL